MCFLSRNEHLKFDLDRVQINMIMVEMVDFGISLSKNE